MQRARILWADVRDSLWFIPALFTAAGVLLAVVLVNVERGPGFGLGPVERVVFSGGAEGARGVLSAIAGGLITVTGVVFSVTIVALQLASSQFTPRILRNFTADRANQVVLGVFIGTFTYTLLVLRTVYSATDDRPGFIPQVAVTVAVALVLVSIGFLIFFINHAARSIQVAFILDRVAESTVQTVERIFPEQVGSPDPAPPPDPRGGGEPSAPVFANGSGYLQAVDGDALFALGKRTRAVLAMEPHVGDFVLEGDPLVRVWPPSAAEDPAVVKSVRKAFVLGPERTRDQDVEFGLIEISDIAVKALSPGINDPTTALRCIDRLSEILLLLGTRAEPRRWRTREGRIHYVARDSTFERGASVAFGQITHFGADNPLIVWKLLDAISRLRGRVQARHRDVLDEHRATLLRQARLATRDPEQLARLERGEGPNRRK
jgi:uncharacterized membrane protein